jgi:hypothetical protein
MIRITRCACPAIIGKGRGLRYNKKEVVVALWKMQNQKCCYCEQKIPEEGHGKAVEHFHPKAVFKDLENEWGNLLLACAYCNGKKSDLFPTEVVPIGLTNQPDHPKVIMHKGQAAGRILIDPSDPADADPEEHIEFIISDESGDYGIAREKNGSDRGRATIQITGIYRSFHVNQRRRHLHNLQTKYYELLRAIDDGDLEMARNWRDALIQSTRSPAQFTGVARQFYRQKRIEERFSNL